VLAGLVFWFSEHKEAQQISANISARWEPDGIFAYHSESKRGVAAIRQRALSGRHTRTPCVTKGFSPNRENWLRFNSKILVSRWSASIPFD
jgi:hypothetical protein